MKNDYNFNSIRDGIKKDTINNLINGLEELHEERNRFINDNYIYKELDYLKIVIEDLEDVIECYLNALILINEYEYLREE